MPQARVCINAWTNYPGSIPFGKAAGNETFRVNGCDCLQYYAGEQASKVHLNDATVDEANPWVVEGTNWVQETDGVYWLEITASHQEVGGSGPRFADGTDVAGVLTITLDPIVGYANCKRKDLPVVYK